MKRITTVLCVFLGIIFLTACVTTAPVNKYKRLDAKYRIESFKVNLSFKVNDDRYYTEDEMTLYLKEIVEAGLKEANVYYPDSSDSAGLSIEINYYRAFSGEATPWPSNSITRPVHSWNAFAEKGGEILFYFEQGHRTYSSGLLGNLKSVFTQDLGNNKQASEHQYLNQLAHNIVSRLISQ